MNRSPAEIRDRWLNYGRRYARYPTLWDSSLAFASGPLAPEAGTLQDYSGRTAGAAWSVGAGDSPKYVQGSVQGQGFWAGWYDGNDDKSTASVATQQAGTLSWWQYPTATHTTNQGQIGSPDTGGLLFGSQVYLRKVYAGLLPNARVIINADSVWPLNTWKHWCLKWDSAASPHTVLYINGAVAGTATGAWTAVTRTSLITAPVSYLGSRFAGSIASVSMMQRPLTTNEISILATHPLAAFEVDVPRYWSFATSTHLWPWQIRRSRRVRGHR